MLVNEKLSALGDLDLRGSPRGPIGEGVPHVLNLGLGLLGPRRVVVVLYGHRVEETVVYGVQVDDM